MKDELKNENDLKYEDNLKNEDELKNEDVLKNCPPQQKRRHFHAKTTSAKL